MEASINISEKSPSGHTMRKSQVPNEAEATAKAKKIGDAGNLEDLQRKAMGTKCC